MEALDSPPQYPVCLWSPAQLGPQPPNTFHRGRLLRAHTGRGRAVEPGTRGAWERSTRKEPHGHLDPARPPAPLSLLGILPIFPLPCSALSRHIDSYMPFTEATGHPNPNGTSMLTGTHTHTHTQRSVYTTYPECVQLHTNIGALAHTGTQRYMQMGPTHTVDAYTQTQTCRPRTHIFMIRHRVASPTNLRPLQTLHRHSGPTHQRQTHTTHIRFLHIQTHAHFPGFSTKS